MLYGSDGPADKAAELPYELQALEVALSAVCKALDLETNEVEARICPALDNLAQKVYKRDLDDVRNLKSRLNRVCARAVKVKQVVLPTNCTYAVPQVLASTPNCLELGVSNCKHPTYWRSHEYKACIECNTKPWAHEYV